MMLVRKPAVAGMFYPENESELRKVITDHLEDNPANFTTNKIFGIVAPHAGYMYSGGTAASAYNLLINRHYSKVVVLSPSHREFFHGVSVYNGEAYITPLGELKVDKELRDRLTKISPVIKISNMGHGAEHALEVQLPFLQSVLSDFTLLPIVIGDQSSEFVYSLAEAIAEIWDENTLVVASTDLSHFHSRETAERLDGIVESHIDNFEFAKLQDDLEFRNCEACGGGAVVALMKAAQIKGFRKAKVLKHTDSSDITGDTREVVGYLSAVVYE